MGSVVGVVLLKLAHVSFPSKVSTIDERNGKIILVRWDMLHVGIESLGLLHFTGHLLNLGLVCTLKLSKGWTREVLGDLGQLNIVIHLEIVSFS